MGTVDIETAAALRAALEKVRSGELTGIAAIEFYEGGYRFVLTGSALQNPALTASTLLVAQVEVARSASLPASIFFEAMPKAVQAVIARHSGKA